MTALLAIHTEFLDADGGNATISLAEPGGLASGELLLTHLVAYNPGSVTVPGAITGFTNIIASYGQTTQLARVQQRVADGSEGPTFTSAVGTSQYNDGWMGRIVGSHPTTPIDGSNSASGSATNANLPAVTTAVDCCLAVAFVVTPGTIPAAPPTGWFQWEMYGFGGNANAVYFKWVPVAGTTGTSNINWTTTGVYNIAVVTIAPATQTNPYLVGVGAQVVGTTTATPTYPGGYTAVADDLAVVHLGETIADTGEFTTPTNWTKAGTQLNEVGAQDIRCSVYYKKLTASEALPAWAGDTADGMSVQCQIWRGVDTTTPMDATAVPSEANAAGTFTPTGITTVTNNAVVVAFVTTSDDNAINVTTPGAFGVLYGGPDFDTVTGADHAVAAAAKTQAAFGAVTAPTFNQVLVGTDQWAAVVIALRPASSGVTGTVAVTLDTFTPAASGTIGENGTVAVTLAVFAPAASGTIGVNGTAAPTLAVFTPAASGTSTPPAFTGTVAVTLDVFVSAASGTVGAAGEITGTVAVTLGSFTPTASGTRTIPDITGTVAVTLAVFTPTASGTATPPAFTGTTAVTLGVFTPAASGTVTAPVRTGTVAVTLASFTPSATGIVANGLFPVAVSADGRFLKDQVGDPWFGVGDTAWSLTGQLTTTEITTYLEDRAGRGINFVLFNAIEHLFADNAPNNANDDSPFTGTAFTTGINDVYWDVVDHAVDEAARLGITLMICPAYLGFAGTEEGWDTEIVAATNGNMTTYGNSLASRYGSAVNITWLIGHDKNPSATEEAREAALSDALQAGTAHLVTVGGVEQLGSDAWEGSGVDYDYDTVYFRSTDAPAAQTATGWAASPTMPTGFLEGLYEGDGTTPARCRSMMYGPLCAGATYIFFGNNPIWQFDTGWEAALDNEGSLDLSVFAGFVASLGGNWSAMAPDTTDTFLTVGEGTGATRASARFDGDGILGVLAVAYRPHSGSASLTFDLTEFTAVATVRIRKFDPSSAAYTTIGTYATTGTQAVGSLGTNAAGDTDWVLVFEGSNDRTGTVAVTLGSFTPTASGTYTPPAVTGTTAVTLATFVAAASGTSTPPAFTGTVSVTVAAFTAAADGTYTPPAVTGTSAVTLAAFTSSAAGVVGGPGEVVGTTAITLNPFTAAASGTRTLPAITGTVTATLDPFTPAASGTVTLPAITGTATPTLAGFTAIAAGTFIPAITGTVAVTLGLFIAVATQAPYGGHGAGTVVWRDGGTGTATSRDTTTTTVGAQGTGTGQVTQP